MKNYTIIYPGSTMILMADYWVREGDFFNFYRGDFRGENTLHMSLAAKDVKKVACGVQND